MFLYSPMAGFLCLLIKGDGGFVFLGLPSSLLDMKIGENRRREVVSNFFQQTSF